MLSHDRFDLKFYIDVESIAAGSGQGKVFQALRIAIGKSCFGIDIGHILVDDPQVAANQTYGSAGEAQFPDPAQRQVIAKLQFLNFT